MSANNHDILVTELCRHLFAALDGLGGHENPIGVERAHAFCEMAQTIINSAEVEVDRLRVAGGAGNCAYSGHRFGSFDDEQTQGILASHAAHGPKHALSQAYDALE